MKKKIAVLLTALAMVSCAAFAGVLQLGANAQLGFPMESLREPENISMDNLFQADNFYYGPEMKLNLWFLDLDETLSMQFADSEFQMRNDLFADIYFTPLFLRVSAGVGLQTQLVADGEWIDYGGFGSMIDSSFMSYRAGLGFCFGPVEISLHYMVPGSVSIASRDEFYKPDFSRSTVSLGLLFDLV